MRQLERGIRILVVPFPAAFHLDPQPGANMSKVVARSFSREQTFALFCGVGDLGNHVETIPRENEHFLLR